MAVGALPFQAYDHHVNDGDSPIIYDSASEMYQRAEKRAKIYGGGTFGSVIAIGLIPVEQAGFIAAGEAIVGNDSVTGEELSREERIHRAKDGASDLLLVVATAGTRNLMVRLKKPGRYGLRAAPKGRTIGSRWRNPDGSWKYPGNDGFKGRRKDVFLEAGTRLDRYGHPGGGYLSPQKPSFAQRALPPGTKSREYNVYEVVKPFPVDAGRIAPWFDQSGMGIQYKLKWGLNVAKLLKYEFIVKVNQ